jgi:hypothetical protein
LLFAKRYRGEMLTLGEDWAKVLAIDLQELRRTPWYELIHPDDVEMLRKWREDVRQGRATAPSRFRVRAGDGRYLFMEVDALSVSDADLIVGSARRLDDEAAEPDDSGVLVIGDIEIDMRARLVRAQDDLLHLTVSEFELLKLLVRERGRVFSADEIAREIWGYASAGSKNFLQAHVSRLRRKLAAAGASNPVTTVRGIGYVVR